MRICKRVRYMRRLVRKVLTTAVTEEKQHLLLCVSTFAAAVLCHVPLASSSYSASAAVIQEQWLNSTELALLNEDIHALARFVENRHELAQHGGALLHQAIEQNAIRGIEVLLEAGADPESVDNWDSTCLHKAAECNRGRATVLLLDYGANIEARNGFGETPLHVAVSCGGLASFLPLAARVLLDYDADPDVLDAEGRTALETAIDHGNEKATAMLLECNASFGLTTVPPLHLAAYNGDKDAVELQLSQCACHSAAWHGETPLHFAARFGHSDVALLLAQRGSDVNGLSENGMTPLHLAAFHGLAETVQILLESGADIDAADFAERTPLLLAVDNGHQSTVQVLAARGANLKAKWGSGLTPLFQACLNQDVDMWNLLKALGAIPDSLHAAAAMGDLAAMAVLIEEGVDVNEPYDEGWGPLHAAAEFDRVEAAKTLVHHGADVNIRTDWFVTPLHVAAANGAFETAQYLLGHGADPNVTDHDFRTPLAIAGKEEDAEMVNLLRAYGGRGLD